MSHSHHHRFDKPSSRSSSSDTDRVSKDSRHTSRRHGSEDRDHDRNRDRDRKADREYDRYRESDRRDPAHERKHHDRELDTGRMREQQKDQHSATTSAPVSNVSSSSVPTSAPSDRAAANTASAPTLASFAPTPPNVQPVRQAPNPAAMGGEGAPMQNLAPPTTGYTRREYDRYTLFFPVLTTVTKQLVEKIIDQRSRSQTYTETHETANSKCELTIEQVTTLENDHYARIFTQKKISSAQIINGKPIGNVKISSLNEVKRIR